MLRARSRERLGGFQNPVHNIARFAIAAGLNGRHQAAESPFLAAGVGGLAQAVGVGHQQIPRGQRYHTLVKRRFAQHPDHGAGGLQRHWPVTGSRLAQQHGRLMPGIHIVQEVADRIVTGHEHGRVGTVGANLVEQFIDGRRQIG